jgi:signal transduction histidine kinase
VSDTDGLGGWIRAHPGQVDAVLVGLVLAAFEMPAFDPYRHGGGPVWPLWGLAIAVPLVWRRRFPVTVLAVTLGATAGALVTRSGRDWGGLSLMAILLGASIALANAASVLPTDVSRRLGLVAAATVTLTNLDRYTTPDVIAAQLMVIGAAWVAGEAVRARRNELTVVQERVTRQAEQAADEERARIANELHDVIAHQLSVIAVQAGAARVRLGADPLAATGASPQVESLLTIEDASRQALAELRRALGVLRSGDAAGLAPQPRLDQLDALASRLRRAGLPLDVTTTGDVRAVPESVGVSAYRIIQEALTNVLNHAGRVATTVRVACTPAAVEVDVRNERPVAGHGPAPASVRAPATGGHGLIGMRARVAAYGGSLDAGALASGGFAVTARIPLR